MKASKKDPDAEFRALLEPLADQFVRANPEQRRRAVAPRLPHSEPRPLRMLAELLVARLDGGDAAAREGGAATLALLGPHILPTIRFALIGKQTVRRLLHLARVVAAISRGLTDEQRSDLLKTLLIAEGLALTPECRAAVWAAIGSLHEAEFEGHLDEYEAQRRENEERAAELIAQYSAPRRKSRAQRGQATRVAPRCSPTGSTP
jgi:hypothetical protein